METILTTEDAILHVVGLYQLSLVKLLMLYQFVILFVETDTYLNQKKNVIIWPMDVIVIAKDQVRDMLVQILEELLPVYQSVGTAF